MKKILRHTQYLVRADVEKDEDGEGFNDPVTINPENLMFQEAKEPRTNLNLFDDLEIAKAFAQSILDDSKIGNTPGAIFSMDIVRVTVESEVIEELM